MGAYSPAERAMRVSGQPSIGSGVVFPVREDKITVEPFTIPDHWFRIIGIDLGFDHPNGVACVAWDNENDVYYLYDEYSEQGETPSMHANAIRERGGSTIPVVVPHDAFKRVGGDGGGSGKKFVQMYADFGLNVVMEPFSNPPGADGKTHNSVEWGVNHMLNYMEAGKFKVFTTCRKFLQETKLYCRKDGRIHDRNDDMISSTRYAMLMASRFARPGGALQDSGYYFNSNKPLTPSWHSEIV